MNVLGVDPGLSGAVAVYDGDNLVVEDMPVLPGEKKGFMLNIVGLYDLLTSVDFMGIDHAYVEKVGAMSGQGVSSTFKFGEGYGAVKGVIAGCGIPMTLISPVKWKGEFGLTNDKDRSLLRATEWFPKQAHYFKRKKDNGRAEAALLARYGHLLLTTGKVR